MFKKFYLSDIIRNADEIYEGLRDLLVALDKEHSPFQIDVYLYINDWIGTIDTFTNVGGNSWLNDKHFTLTSVNYEYDNKIDVFDIDDIADILGKTLTELRTECANWLGRDIDHDNESELDGEIYSFVDNNAEYRKKIIETYDDYCDTTEYDIDGIIDRFCNEYLEEMMYIYEADENSNIFEDIAACAFDSDEFKITQLCSVACMLNRYDRFSCDSERYGNENCIQEIKFFKGNDVVKSLKVGEINE